MENDNKAELSTMTEKNSPQPLFCEKCGRELGPELLECHERSRGECPYEIDEKSDVQGGVRVLLFGVFAWLIVFIDFGLNQFLAEFLDRFGLSVSFLFGKPRTLVIFLLLLGAVFIILGINIASKKYVKCSHTTSGQSWMQTYRFGLKSAQVTTSAFQPVLLETALTHPTTFPASISALCNYQEEDEEWSLFIADLYYVALLSLLQQKAIKLYYMRLNYKGLWRARERHSFVLAPETSIVSSQLDGTVEQKILQALKEYPLPEEYFRAFPSGLQLLSPCLPFEYLLHSLSECLFSESTLKAKMKSSAGSFSRDLFSGLIAEEAAQRKLGTLEKIKYNRQKRFTLFPESQEKLAADYQSAQELHEDFLHSYPDIAQEFRKTLIQIVEREEPSK